MRSYWEQSVWLSGWDVIILGAGLVGLQSARQLLAGNEKLKVLVLERGPVPFGASTRNAGFACFGSLSELLAHEKLEGTESMVSLVRKRFEGLHALRRSVPDDRMGYESFGGFEVFTESDHQTYLQCEKNRERLNGLLQPITGLPDTFVPADEHIHGFGFHGTNHMILNRAEGQLNSGKLMMELWKGATASGAVILGGVQVLTVANNRVETTIGVFTTNQILITTNGFTKDLISSLDIKPGRGQVLVTEPIPGLKVRGSFHYDDGFYYFRDVDGRVLLGGGRNLDFQGEETTNMEITGTIQNRLENLLHTVILPGKNVKIEQRWSGIMAFGSKKSPIIEEVEKGVWVAVRMSGMGVALGTLVAREVVEKMKESHSI